MCRSYANVLFLISFLTIENINYVYLLIYTKFYDAKFNDTVIYSMEYFFSNFSTIIVTKIAIEKSTNILKIS